MTEKKRCFIVGGGNFCAELFNPQKDDMIIAADAGFEALKKIGITPDTVVGDFDSLGYTPGHSDVIKHSPIKDDTDTMLAVEIGTEKGCEEFHIFGATGGRIAHTLGNIQILKHLADRNMFGYIFDRDTVITAISNRTLTFRNASGYISIVPFGCNKATVTLSGFKYELEHGIIPCNRPLGISNEFCGETSNITVHDGTIIAVWENTDVIPE